MLLTTAAKVVYVVLIAYCNVNHEQCGLASGHTTYKTLAACTKEAKSVNHAMLEQILAGSNIAPPWDTKVACGTPKQGAETEVALRKWAAEKQAAMQRQQPEEEEHPGDRDPAPDGS